MKNTLILSALMLLSTWAHAQKKAPNTDERIRQAVKKEYPSLLSLYTHLHQNPELSFYEEETAARMALELRNAGFEVTEGYGGYGVVGVLKNGDGPVLLIRADMDGLPVEEKTGLPYASKKQVKDHTGMEVFTMHACGHDVHMTSWVGTARMLSNMKDAWKGTVIMIGQPAEEKAGGAQPMLDRGLYKDFPKPDYAIALHTSASLPAGQVAYVPGYALANVDMMEIVVYGVGGHGAYPHTTIDPIVLSAKIIMALQTIVSREISPLEPAVVTVGQVHGGTKGNIIPDEVRMELTMRSYSEEVREHIVAAIRRIIRGEAIAAGVPEDKMPVITSGGGKEYLPSVYNTPELTAKVAQTFQRILGEENVKPTRPVMGGEDFSLFGRTADKIPIFMYWLGGVDPAVYEESLKSGKGLPSLHSPFFAPLPEPTLTTGVISMTAAALDLLNTPVKKK